MNRMHFTRNNKNKSSGKGFYVSLALCICAVSVVGWNSFAKKSNPPTNDPNSEIASDGMNDWIDKYPLENDIKQTDAFVPGVENDSSSNLSGQSISSVSPVSSEIPASSETPVSSQAPVSSENTVNSEEALSTTNQPLVYALPSGTTVIKAFSGTSPVYSLTFNDWRIHEGTDFKADSGSPVKSVSDGIVKQIYKDEMLGNVVVIDHVGGLEVYYCGLGDTLLVKEGDGLVAGDEIGSVGKIPCEILEESHFHLMIKANGKFVDPMAALGKNQ